MNTGSRHVFLTLSPLSEGALAAPPPHHAAKKPSLVPLCVNMAAHLASSAVKHQGRLRASALSQSALAPKPGKMGRKNGMTPLLSSSSMAREFYQPGSDIDTQLVKGARRLKRVHDAQLHARTTSHL